MRSSWRCNPKSEQGQLCSPLYLGLPASTGTVPGGRARLRIGSWRPFRLALMPESTTSPHSRHRQPEKQPVEIVTSSNRMVIIRPWQRGQCIGSPSSLVPAHCSRLRHPLQRSRPHDAGIGRICRLPLEAKQPQHRHDRPLSDHAESPLPIASAPPCIGLAGIGDACLRAAWPAFRHMTWTEVIAGRETQSDLLTGGRCLSQELGHIQTPALGE